MAEEVLFRGILLDGFSRHLRPRAANFVQAVVFVSFHDDLKFAPMLLFLGIAPGMLRRRTGNLATGIVLHAFNNLIALFAIGG